MKLATIFRKNVNEHLVKLTDQLVPMLSKLIEYNFPSEVVSLEFEVFTDGFTQEFPVRAFFMDSDNSEFFLYENNNAVYPSPIDPRLLEIPQVFSDEFEEKFIGKDEHLDTFTLAGYELIEWFKDCWLKAGGEKFKLKANIKLHGDIKELNLLSSEWVEW